MKIKDRDQAYIEACGGNADPELLGRYAYKASAAVQRTIRGGVDDDPVARQYIPQVCELDHLPEDEADPIGDEAYSPVKGIVHRYPDRVLFKPVSVCPVYCRYCFRREIVGPKGDIPADMLSAAEQDVALEYIAAHREIWEVILTGGDPLMCSPRRLSKIMNALNDIEHVRVVRFHTRVPVADPVRVTMALCEVLSSSDMAVYMAVHVNHVQEITDDVCRALRDLRLAGVELLSQSVLLKGVNDDAQVLEELYRCLVCLHVKPYYLHHLDFAQGISHFRVSIAEGQEIVRQLRGRVSGLCQPTYMLDIPGGHGKIPLVPCYIEALEQGRYHVKDYQGHVHSYPPSSGEKIL